LSTPGHEEGVLQGDCQVAIVVESKNGKRAIAERYGDYASSDQMRTVDAREENFHYLTLNKGGQ